MVATIRFGTRVDADGFDLLAADWHAWYESAEKNRRAARVLAGAVAEDWAAKVRYIDTLAALPEGQSREGLRPPEVPALDGPALLMYALALENLLKGIRVAREPALVKGGELPRSLMGHDLVKLAGWAKQTLSDEETGALRVLSACTISWGRYPLAASVGKMPGNCGYDLARGGFEALYERFAAALLSAVEQKRKK